MDALPDDLFLSVTRDLCKSFVDRDRIGLRVCNENTFGGVFKDPRCQTHPLFHPPAIGDVTQPDPREELRPGRSCCVFGVQLHQHIQEQAGKHFDHRIVEVFLKLYKKPEIGITIVGVLPVLQKLLWWYLSPSRVLAYRLNGCI